MGEIHSQKLSFVFLMYGTIVSLARRYWGKQNSHPFARRRRFQRGSKYLIHVTIKARQDMKNNKTNLNMLSAQEVVVYNAKPKRLGTTLLCIRHASYWWTERLHVKQRWSTVPRVHYHSRLTWHCFSKDWLPGPLQLEVNRQFSISRERGFISKSRGGGGVRGKREKVKSSSHRSCRCYSGGQ